ncbi:sensor histidine kinase [Chryseolinea lacunae]|uniref:Histidine kinase n=1 Tax=Chryseolinea lacunae TaxID=2801331 RepID=A0ABS1KUL5_9BACT|nr:histidine kinase [Chryseolinea lacunae]MBL0743145.1 histidine kinase [Chryseolinea lacunae]
MSPSQKLKAPETLFDVAVTRLLLRSRVALHLLFWVCFLLYEGVIWGMIDGNFAQRFSISLLELPLKIAATYFTLYVLIDKLLINKRYGQFLFALVASMIAFGVLFRVLSYFVVYPLYYPDGLKLPLFFVPKILIYMVTLYALVAIVASFHLLKHWYNHQQAAQVLEQTTQQLEKEKLEAELKLLKSQVNPHFLFNTLNNLYALTLHNPEKAHEMVHKLSELMSYMLHDCNQPEVSLEKELHHLRNYIALEAMRYTERLDVAVNVYDDVTDIAIAPLLILPFVENSFKHGVHNQIDQAWVRVDIQLQENQLLLKVENSVASTPSAPQPFSGIGLQNVKKRLALIYPERHTLQILSEDETFLVVLKIELSGARIRKPVEVKPYPAYS